MRPPATRARLALATTCEAELYKIRSAAFVIAQLAALVAQGPSPLATHPDRVRLAIEDLEASIDRRAEALVTLVYVAAETGGVR